MLLALWAKFMGHFFIVKFNVLGCIVTTRNLENQSQNPHRAICSPAISLRVQPLQEIWSDFAHFTKITKMPPVPSKMDGFQILKILLVAKTKDYHNLPKQIILYPNYSGLSSIYSDFSWKNPLYATSKL